MSERRLPPYPLGGDWRSWARQLVEYLSNEARSEEFVAPRAVGLLHQVPSSQEYRTTEDGILMFDPNLGVPVYSHDGAWNQFTAQGDLNYLVTDDAGDGSVVDDINNTDFTGQTGAVGTCAQCPVATNTSFYHKGIQYLYTGPTPASYGIGCSDIIQEDYLIPVGVGTFLALSDTPDDYTGFGDWWPRVSPSEGTLVFDQIEEEDIINLDRVKWRGNWVQQTYVNNDMVLADANWLMIANKTTTDVAPPRPEGNPLWDMPDAPAWVTNSFNGVVKSGREWEITQPIDMRGLAVWIPTVTADTNYVLFAYSYPTGQPDQLKALQIAEPLLVEGQWTVVTLNRTLFTAGTTFGFYIDALNSGSDTFVTGGWGRAPNTNDGTVDPGAGQWNTNNADTRVSLSYTDLDTTDRTSELQGVIAGSTIQIVQTDDASKSVTWTINADGIDQTTHINFANVTVADTGPNGQPDIAAVCTITITVPVPQPTDYVRIIGGNPTHTWGTSKGILELGGVSQSVDADAFGVRALVDEYVISPDWDIANMVGSGGGGGGGSGGASKFTELADTPADYAGQAGKAAIVNGTEDALEFGEAGKSTFVELDDTPADYTGSEGYEVVVNGAGDGLEFLPKQIGADPTTVGMVAAFPIDSVPAGWLVCDGSTFDAGDYPFLGTYLGSTTLPDLQDMFLKGATPDLAGTTGGEKDTLLTEGQLPAHGHDAGTLTAATEALSANFKIRKRADNDNLVSGGTNVSVANDGSSLGRVGKEGSGSQHSVTFNLNHDHSISGSVSATGNGDPIDNQPQHYVVVWAIRAVPTDPNDPVQGASNFLELSDTPVSYTGQAGKIPTVNGTEDGLEFGDPPAQNFIGLTDTPADYTGQAGKFAQVATEEDRLIFEAITSGATVGDTFPVTPQAGQLHFKTGKHIGLYIWYEDGSSSQWVQTNGGGLDLIDEPIKVVHTASTADYTDYSTTTTTSYAANGSRCYYVPKYKNTHVRITGEAYWRQKTNGVDDWDMRGQPKHYNGSAYEIHAPQINGVTPIGVGTRLQFRITNTNTTTDGDVYTTPEPFKWWFPPGYGRILDNNISPNGHECMIALISYSGSYSGTKYMLQTNFYIEEVMIRDTSDISFAYNDPNDRDEQPDYPNWEP